MRRSVPMTLLPTLILVVSTSTAYAEQRVQWNVNAKINAQVVDDASLESVSGRGSLEEDAVKAIQNGAKINDVLNALAQLPYHSVLAIDSADKQATQTQLRLAQNVTQTIGQTMQLNSTVSFMASPATPAPVMSPPIMGLPMLPR